MIYLAIDTDVWLWLIIHGIDVEENYFDELCYWLENAYARCIVPDNIIEEWERNKDAKIATIKADLKKATFLNKSVIQRSEFLNSVYNADNFEELAKNRVNKVAEIFEKYADIANVSDDIKIQAGNRTLAKLAPSHGKHSYADAVNILSILALIRENALTPVIFTSKNKSDFSDPSDDAKVHRDLLPLFDEVKLEYFQDTNHLFHKRLKTQLPSFKEFLTLKKKKEEREKTLIDEQERSRISNPDQDFITNTETVNQILQQNRPTSFQFKMIRDLIGNDESCRKYFFEKVSKPAWFAFLEENGYLDPASHPGPVESPQDTYLSHWLPLGYLERLAKQITADENSDMIQPLISLIKKISEAQIDNDLTSTAIIRILSNLPNQAITLDILSFLPIWFSETTNKMFPTTATCTYLLPKFINDISTADDVQKGEFILNYLLGVSQKGVEIDNTPEKIDTSYFANAYPPMLMDALIKKDLLKNIARLCSEKLFYHFAKNLRLVILDYPKGLHLPVIQGAATFEVKIALTQSDLLFSLTTPGSEQEFSNAVISDYDKFDKKALREAISAVLGELGLTYERSQDNEDRMRGLIFALTVDRLSVAGAVPIADMDERTTSSKHFRLGYGILLSRYLTAITEIYPELGAAISKELFYDHQYRLPFFRRVVLHNISTHFESQRALLSQILSPRDPHQLFDDYTYRPDLFNLLKHNQQHFDQSEVDLISNIINTGPLGPRADDDDKKSHWQFTWFLALNQISPFKEQYKLIGAKYELKDRDVDPTRTMRFRSGTVPPITSEQLLEMDVQALVNYLQAFNPKDRWEEPNIDGLGSILQKAVIAKSDKFLAGINLFLATPYIYIYHLLYGLLEAGRKTPKEFDWAALMHFGYSYINQGDFDTEKRMLKADGWKADKYWVMGVIAYHISEVSKEDAYVKEHQLLNSCRDTLLLMYQYFIVSEEEEPQNKDYISHTLNSDNGKFLRGCLDYCLCKARLTNIKRPDLDGEFLNIFENSLEKASMDAYILLGYYWQQFNYLNRHWLSAKIKGLKSATPANWKAFMGGFLFSPAPSNKKTLALVMPHYKRAVIENLELKMSGTNGLANHLTALYFWGMLDLSPGSVLKMYFTEMPVTAIAALLHSIFFNEKYFETLKQTERLQLENRVIDLIDLIHNHFANQEEPETIELRRSTVNLIYLIGQLNARNTQVIKTGILLGSKQYHNHDLFERLFILMEIGTPITTAEYLAGILETMIFPDHVHLMDDDKKHLSVMIQFLYNQQQRQSADTLCNRLSKAGQSFAKDIYLKNNQ